MIPLQYDLVETTIIIIELIVIIFYIPEDDGFAIESPRQKMEK